MNNMLLQNPGGKYVELDEIEALQWIKQGFRVVEDKAEIEAYQLERSIRLGKLMPRNKREELPSSREIYFSSVYEGNDGYGVSRKYIKEGLEKLGIICNENYNGQKVGLLYHNPYGIRSLQTPIKILYTMFESDRIPDDWIPYLKECDKIIVPSDFVAGTFRDRGFDPEVVPLGYNDRAFTFKDRKTAIEEKRDFIFLHYNAYNIRKGFPEVLRAFVKEFRNNEAVKLVLKTTLDHVPFPLPPSQYPNIKLLRGQCSEAELVKLVHDADCFVFPSRGEGFGMTPLENMGTGLPVIVPNAHGISEYFNSDCMYEVKVKEKCPALYSKYKGMDVGKMVVCDTDDLAKQMRFAYEHQKYNLEVGQKAAVYAKNYTFNQTAQRLAAIFDTMWDKEPTSDPDYLRLEAV